MEKRDEILEEPLGVENTGEGKVFAADGTDLTLIREMLELSPEERLRALEEAIRGIMRLRDALNT